MSMIRNRRIAPVAVSLLLLLPAACRVEPGPASAPLPRDDGTGTWVAIEPTQCLTNAWEQDWLEQHDGDYAAYPKDPTRPGLEPEEIAIIQDYYARQGVVVAESATAPKFEAVCAACDCPEGHTMFLMVRGEDVDTMIGFGYRVEAPPATE